MTEIDRGSRTYVAGHTGMVGSALVRELAERGFERVLVASRSEVDLTNRSDVDRFFRDQKPEFVYIAAARVGGIVANSTYPGDFIRDNLLIATNMIDAARIHGVRKVLFLGSSCIYPRDSPQPIREEYLLTGPLESTNEWYAIAKIAGIKMCAAYRRQYGLDAISLMPTNLYGPGDNFDLEQSHVIPALLRRFHEAKVSGAARVECWGSGRPRREFLHVDDLAKACIHLMEAYSGEEIVNVGSGEDVSIADLASTIADIVGFGGRVEFDSSKPDGTPRKLLDISRVRQLGWRPTIALREGLERTYHWFLESVGHGHPVRGVSGRTH